MNFFNIVGNNLPDSYYTALLMLDKYGKEVPCPDYDTNMIECSANIEIENPLKEPMIAKLGIYDTESLQQYKMEIEDGILDFMIGVTENSWEYTYHERIGNQLDFVIEELKRNPYSRRAVINTRNNDVDMNTDHPACLQHIQFFIRDNALNMIVMMRSNDAVNATFMNMFAFIGLQKIVADKLGIKVGTYTHRANSFHVYEKDYSLFRSMVDTISKEIEHYDFLDKLAYNYCDEWKEIMESEIPKIEAKVMAQKKKYDIE